MYGMMKFIMMVMFMNLMVVWNSVIMFYYNLCYLLSFMLIFFYMNKDVEWFNIMMSLGCNYYSMMLVMLSFWILGLMFMCLNKEMGEVGLKLVIFINMLMVLIMFFLYMDLILFYLMFEISLIPTFFLIIYWGSNVERVSAGYYMMMYMLLISFPLLVYIFNMYMYLMTMKFSLMVMLMSNYEITFWGFLMIYMAFFIKMPIYLFHIWLPKAHVEAPVYGSMVLAGVLLKMGSYGLIRLMEMFYKIGIKYSYIIFSVSIIGSIIIGILCLVQIDMKSMVAYSSVVHMNLMLCSLMTYYKVGILGSYVMMISHGLCSSGMFFMVNLYYDRSGSRLLFLNKGMVSNLPTIMMWWFLFCIMNFSFPLSLNFIGETLMLMSIVNWDLAMVMYLMLICFFSSVYSLYLFSYIYHGKNIYYENKIYNSSLKEYMILINHYFPLFMFMLNLVLFM
uniref:NADH-ubiquinone oxidoreductase chain 4 n=2 Tax=Atta sexdens rubropilosa TaxID=64786 RepID=A0A2H4PU26_9HYME|nr:NADH dehydrogenase subunit 4 [Atta sexdens rubropilosa]